MAKINPDELNKKLQSTNLIFLAAVSAIFLAFWYFAMPRGTLPVPLAIVALAFILYFYALKPRMQRLISNLSKDK